jgi:hypothetical protein
MARSPLFDIYDPYGTLGAERLEDLMPPEEKDSLLRGLANMGASGLSAFGYLLDTPGAFVRGLLAGDPLSVFGTSDDRVTGRELLRQYGLVGEEDTWGNFTGGLGAEVLLDPSTYLTFGLAPFFGGVAKTTAGRLAQRAGMLSDDLGLAARELGRRTGRNVGTAQLMRETPEQMLRLLDDTTAGAARQRFRDLAGDQADDLLQQPMAATNQVSLPGIGSWAFDLYDNFLPGAGDRIAQAADYLGSAAQAAPFIGPIVRSAQAMFDPRVMGMSDEQGQWLGREITQQSNIAGRQARQRLSNAYVDAARNVGEELFRSREFDEAFGNVMEGQFGQVPEALRRHFEPGGGAFDLVQAARRWQRDAVDRANQLGIPLASENLPNDIEYFFRQSSGIADPTIPEGWARHLGPQYDRSRAVASVVGGASGRRDYTRAFPRWILNKMARDGDLQNRLRQAVNAGDSIPEIIDGWVATNAPDWLPPGTTSPFQYMAREAEEFDPADVAAAQRALEDQGRIDKAYRSLADTLRALPAEHAAEGVPFYGSALNDLQTYVGSRARNEATADVLLRNLADNNLLLDQAAQDVAGGTAISIQDALKQLGFDTAGGGVDEFGMRTLSPGENAFVQALNRTGRPLLDLSNIDNLSLPKQYVDQLSRRILGSRVPYEAGPLLRSIDNFTQRFKTLALLWPARYARDAYSGAFAGATQGAFGLGDAVRGARIGSGNYGAIPVQELKQLPDYQRLNTPATLNRLRRFDQYRDLTDEQLFDELVVRKFLSDAGGQGLTQASVVDDIGRVANNINMREAAPGLAGSPFAGVGDAYERRRVPWNLWSMRRRPQDANWLLEAGDAAAQTTDNFNRIGTYLNRIRKGDSPLAAKGVADLTQVNYRPEAFTEFEREFLKRIFPFYSYTKGITPLIRKELVENPGGLMGQSIRVINRGSEPSEDQFVPEYMRQSAAIPLPEFPLLGVASPGITRFLTNIDLPHESVLNLLTPGTGNTPTARAMDAISKTGQNILGQSNPLLKGPLEVAMNRQFFSGRQLSDLYSMVEQDVGQLTGGPLARLLEQAVLNAPGGSRVLGTIRQLRDDRISLPERLAKLGVNALTGIKLQDVDRDKTYRLAARSTLNQILDQAPGMSTFENLSIKPEDIQRLSPEEQRQYLLYRILQSEASRRRREQAKQAELDPLATLGVR